MNIFWIILSLILTFSLQAENQQLIVLRNGEAANNVDKVYNSNPASKNYKPANLTGSGIVAVQKAAKELLAQGFNDSNIAAVFVSPLPRARQTAQLLVNQNVFSQSKVTADNRLTELNAGDLEGKPTVPNWSSSFAHDHHGESLEQVKSRIQDFYGSVLKQYPKGNIIVITHNIPSQDLIEIASQQKIKLQPGEFKVVPYTQRTSKLSFWQRESSRD